MPYVKQTQRQFLAEGCSPLTSGELNYLITETVWLFMRERGITYDTINTCIGALECAKLELYRRIAAPYETDKQRDNGDVYL